MRVLRIGLLIAAAEIGVLVILFSFAFAIQKAHADAAYPFADYVSSTNLGARSVSVQYYGANGATPSGLTMYGFRVNIRSAIPSSAYVLLSGGTCTHETGFPSGTGFQDIMFSTPLNASVIHGSTFWNVQFYTDSGCYTTPMGGTLADIGVAPYTSVYFYWAPPYVPPSLSNILPISPVASGQISTTTSSTAVSFQAQYFYNTASTTDSYNQLDLYLFSSTQASSSVYALTPLATNSTSTMTTNLTLASGSAWTYNWCWGIAAPWGEISGACTPTQYVYVITNPVITALGTTTTNLLNYATSTCSIGNISGCFQNAIAFLFWPTPTDFQAFGQITGNIRTHVPFGYVYIAIGQISAIQGTASSTFTLDIPSAIQTDYFDPIKNGLAAILWALCIIWFFVRIRDLQL